VEEVDGMRDKSLDLSAIGKLRRLMEREKPQIVHTHGSMSARIAARQAGAKVVYTRHCVFPVPERLKKGPGRANSNISAPRMNPRPRLPCTMKTSCFSRTAFSSRSQSPARLG